MRNRNRRILWAINHKTLMPAEVGILRELGYEVYVPKIVDEAMFRSVLITDEYDDSLTIPRHIITELNAFDFYQDTWTPRITEIINRYFSAIISVAYLKMSFEAMHKFDGKVFLRGYGIADWFNYDHLFQYFFKDTMQDLITLRDDDVFFAAGYEFLPEIEPEYLASRAVHLPISAPARLWHHANTQTGEGGYVLFLCSNRLTNDYHAGQLSEFLAAVKDLPYVIVDAVDASNGDPHVRFRPCDDELIEIYQKAAAFYSPAKTPRHSLYSPVEAHIIGVPVVFHGEALLSRLSPRIVRGKVSTSDEAHRELSKLLTENSGGITAEYVKSFVEDQQGLADPFEFDVCLETWRRNFPPLMPPTYAREKLLPVLRRYVRRKFSVLLRPNSMIVSSRWKNQTEMAFAIESLHENVGEAFVDIQELDFSQNLPWFVDALENFGAQEDFGRWTDGDIASLKLMVPLPRKVRVTVTAHAYGPNVGKTVRMKIGRRLVKMRFEDLRVTTFTFTVRPGAEQFDVSWRIPEPQTAPGDIRRLGIAIHSLSIEKVGG